MMRRLAYAAGYAVAAPLVPLGAYAVGAFLGVQGSAGWQLLLLVVSPVVGALGGWHAAVDSEDSGNG
jgi:hypothetical protein